MDTLGILGAVPQQPECLCCCLFACFHIAVSPGQVESTVKSSSRCPMRRPNGGSSPSTRHAWRWQRTSTWRITSWPRTTCPARTSKWEPNGANKLFVRFSHWFAGTVISGHTLLTTRSLSVQKAAALYWTAINSFGGSILGEFKGSILRLRFYSATRNSPKFISHVPVCKWTGEQLYRTQREVKSPNYDEEFKTLTILFTSWMSSSGAKSRFAYQPLTRESEPVLVSGEERRPDPIERRKSSLCQSWSGHDEARPVVIWTRIPSGSKGLSLSAPALCGRTARIFR